MASPGNNNNGGGMSSAAGGYGGNIAGGGFSSQAKFTESLPQGWSAKYDIPSGKYYFIGKLCC